MSAQRGGGGQHRAAVASACPSAQPPVPPPAPHPTPPPVRAARSLKELNAKAPTQLQAYCECMDYYSSRFTKCRKEQTELEEACPVS